MINRRKTLQALGLGTLALTPPGWRLGRSLAQSTGTGFDNPLQIPLLDTGSMDDAGLRHYRLTQPGRREFLPGLTTATLGVNGDYLGPTLLMQRDEQVRLAVENRLGEPTSLHWHGFHVPANQDGGPNQQIEAGDTWNPGFRVMQNGGTFWYHSHVMHKAGEQVYRGLAGLILVRDPREDGLGLPETYGVDDVPLIVQDRRFASNGAFNYLNLYDDVVKGMHGDTLLVNGTWPPDWCASGCSMGRMRAALPLRSAMAGSFFRSPVMAAYSTARSP